MYYQLYIMGGYKYIESRLHELLNF